MDAGYVIAKYLRISSDDGFHGDSQSISGQRDLIDGFIANHPELKHAQISEFSDDGFTGMNFERPGVKRLLDGVKRGEVQCIVVKDFSRFGRNYIEVGDYIEQIFPFLRVRFISINDGYDSAARPNSAGDVSIAFKNLCNDYYCKDLSRKVKSGVRTKWQAGKYISSYEVYGYRKSAEDKHKLVIDQTASPIVRRIFDMALTGHTPVQIAKSLNVDGVPSPMVYLSQKRGIRTWSGKEQMWTNTKIIHILRDIRYTGTLTQGMYAACELGSDRIRKTDKSEWYITEGAHELIISKEDFEQAQGSVRKIKTSVSRTNPSKPSPYHLPVQIRCGGCNHAMVKNGAKVLAYYCRYRHTTADDACVSGKIKIEMLKGVLLTSIQRLYDLWEKRERAATAQISAAPDDTLRQIRTLQQEIGQLDNAKLSLYNRYSDGEISREEYSGQRETADRRIGELSAQVSILEQKNYRQDIVPIDSGSSYEVLKGTPYPVEYSNELVAALVDYVVVHDESRIEIMWRFDDGLAGLDNVADVGGRAV